MANMIYYSTVNIEIVFYLFIQDVPGSSDSDVPSTDERPQR